MSIAKDVALQMIHELKAVNKEMVEEITNNNDLINALIKTCGFTEEDLSNGEFTNTLSKSPNVAYGHTYHEFDEDGCYDHGCEDCAYYGLDGDDEPCNKCNSNFPNSNDCYFEPKHDPRPIKSYDGIYEPISHAYLEIHKAEDCNHSISTCKDCEFHSTKENHVPCVGCKCLNHETGICFHINKQN